MSRETEAARLRRRAEVCRDLAAAAQTEDERTRWLEQASEWAEQANRLEQAKQSR